MADFNELRDQLNKARQASEQAQQQLYATRQSMRRIQAQRAELDRVFSANNRDHIARKAELDAAHKKAETDARRLQDVVARFKIAEAGVLQDFGRLSDPRELIGRFNDDFPILLLPVRIETRWKTIERRNQLWVRIYPDECAVDTFEPELTPAEVQAGRQFWIDWWRAGSGEGQQRAAWRSIVAVSGSGRAAWIIEQQAPLNRAEEPVKPANGIVLVIASDPPLSGMEQTAAFEYFKAAYISNGGAADIATARAALEGVVGPERAAEIIGAYVPVNFTEPRVPADAPVQVAAIQLPGEATGKETNWSKAPVVRVLPDRFVLIGYTGTTVAFTQVGRPIPSPLVAGPDPSATPEDQIKGENGDVVVPPDMLWMTDFDRAVEVGMGFRVDVTDVQASTGFSRLLTIGVRLSADEQAGCKLIEELLQHQQRTRKGFSFVRQGTPTNNVDDKNAGFSRVDDPDVSFDDYLKPRPPIAAPDPWSAPFDGDVFADALGISRDAVRTAHGYNWTDQVEARAMNTALWPATLGYWMQTLMQPVFDAQTIEATREFFNGFVSGRGPIPAIRIGNQPYGILPATAFSRLAWMTPQTPLPIPAGGGVPPFIRKLYDVLRKMDADWAEMAKQVPFVGKPGNPHQTLLDVIGLHPTSVEYYQRYAESLQQLYNMFSLGGLGGALIGAIIAAGYVQSGLQLLQHLGRTDATIPEILNKFFLTSQNLMKGPVIDTGEFSETDGIRPSTADNKNYIEWCLQAARTSLETLRNQNGFKDGKTPNALLYIYLRHALLLGYWDTSIRLHLEAQVSLPASVMRESAFVHVAAAGQGTAVLQSESRFSQLYKTEAKITGDPRTLVADHIPRILESSFPARYLREQLEGLEYLKSLPTARLERLFAEHIDCCTYRLDAWEMGLVRYQLSRMRSGSADREDPVRRGVYVGAFGWLENVRSENKALTPMQVPGDLADIFQRAGDPPLMKDATNGGYIHAPSLNHAVAAAVLRNGYLANATPANPQTMAVNIASDRVRIARSIIEGIRAGQSAGALLGYRFERGLHDRHNQAEVDQFIYRMRRAFPLRANQIPGTKKGDTEGVSIEAIEARNVIDGFKLVEHVRRTESAGYPFGITLLMSMPQPSATQKAAIDAEVNELLNLYDALADLAIAEGVHQAVQGNYDRVAATMDAYSKGGFPPDPAVTQTPRTGIALTHRVGLHLHPGLPPAGTPRAQAEPALNQWLGDVMPTRSDVFCQVEYIDPVTSASVKVPVSLGDLGIEPLDLVYILRTESEKAMAEVDDRILRYVLATAPMRPDASLQISYLFKPASKISVFEFAPMVDALRSVTLRSRPLRASDIALQTEATQGYDQSARVDPTRIMAVRDSMDTLRSDIAAFAAALKARFDDIDNQRALVISDIDTSISAMVELLSRAALLGIPQTGWGTLYDSRRQIFSAVLDTVHALVTAWESRLADFDQKLIDYGNLPAATTDEDKVDLLRSAERLVSSEPINPLPATTDDLRDAIALKRAPFAARLASFKTDVVECNTTTLSDMLAQLRPLLPVTEFDLQGPSLDDADNQIVTLAADLLDRATNLAGEAEKRKKAANDLLAEHAGTADTAKQTQLLVNAAKALLGDDFQIVPEFTITTAQGDEWENALNASRSGDLLRYLTDPPVNMPFPVDTWFYGVARVRPKLGAFEKLTMLTQALSNRDLPLEPIQLPAAPGDRWLALEYPESQQKSGDKLLYTAQYSAPFQKAGGQCGLLVDEWTEVIPGEQETTGITFHYDRPNCEAPQVMLLATPASNRGAWIWQDLVDAVNETLEAAKKRGVEPVHSDGSAYAHLLPATAMAVTLYPISIAANLAVNNYVLDEVQR